MEHQRLIGPGEWIWADSAYPVEAWCVTPFKKPAAYVPENKVFNYWVSHVSCIFLANGLFLTYFRFESDLSTLSDISKAASSH